MIKLKISACQGKFSLYGPVAKLHFDIGHGLLYDRLDGWGNMFAIFSILSAAVIVVNAEHVTSKTH